jgi:hypothetical protein
MNPEMPLLWQRLATSIIEAMHVTGAWNQITNLALSASYGNKPWKDVKRHNFRSLLIGYHGHEGSTDPSRNLDEMTHCGKDGYQACANCSGACYFAWGVPWFGGLSFVSRLWFEEGLTNTPFKMLLSNYDPNLRPTPNLHNCRCQKQTAVAICCRRQLSCSPVAPSHPGVISVPRHSASSFNANTVRSCEESPQFGWVWPNLHGFTTRMHKWVDCWLHQCSASTRNMSWGGMKMQVAHLGRPIRLKTCCHSSSFCYHVESTDCVLLFIFWVRVCLLNEVAFSRNLENWYLPMCNFRSPWILEGRPQCQITFRR